MNVEFNRELESVNLFNLQFLNISNNSLTEVNISNHNFPKLKELYVAQNFLKNTKSFTKLETLKLLDLRQNLIDDYDDLISLAFL